ncbi:MAG: ATP-dependent zinc metalloprotease FtsH [Spirochaetia bacterium]|nr:ATP-dependent zinc metalloprotease FtsH [Spirochaetia bacterium]
MPGLILLLPFVFWGLTFFFSTWQNQKDTGFIQYSEFLEYLKNGNIADVTIKGNSIEGHFKQPLSDGRKGFITNRVEPDLARQLRESGVTFGSVQENTWLRDILSWILPVLLFLGIWLFVMRRMSGASGIGGGLLSVGKSKAKVYMETNTRVTFNDVAGVDEAKDELHEVVNFLKNPGSYGRLGARVPRGVLLVGPPGTGKTLLARAVAGEAGVPFFSISGSEFVEMFVGVGAARVRDLFDEARKRAPAIIFIDELDALGAARIASPMGGNQEKEQTLNQLLSEMDGFDPMTGLMLLAATNRPEILDPALLRSGRFDRQILVDRPDRIGRVQILKVHIRKVRLSESVDPEQIAALTPGFSGADLANLVNEAALLATRRNAVSIEMNDFTMAVERIVAGLEKKNRLLNPKERRTVAYHEMGHAIVAMSLRSADPVHKVSIIPRGIGALGYTIQRPIEDRFLIRKSELEDRIAVLLAGRAAEQLVFGEVSTGASDDLAKATDLARNMVMRFAMVDSLGPVTYTSDRATILGIPQMPTREFSEQTAQAIDDAVRAVLLKGLEGASAILSARRSILENSAEELLKKETLGAEEIALIRQSLPKSD